ncbi:hypothetical protein V493_08379 [Pseudogymnoascus sp. VKM F-4281 (FW-2241)]|nr:hypothetical protein V493_08379 [Pseudogymnoascus sp. VKM F-4281 (FW-2241)]
MSRPKTSHGHRPSPLAQEVHLRPVSEQPNLSVADPIFWKRFSAAIHEAEGADAENGRARSTSASTGGTMDKNGDDWLVRQRQKKRRCRVISWSVALSVVMLITAVAVVAWYFTAGPGKANDEKSKA